jgi:hypothetical protein
MSDNTKKPEQSTPDANQEKVSDLPDKAITDRDAQAVKGGVAPSKNAWK